MSYVVSNPQPARLLLTLLANSRRIGLTFEDAWPRAVQTATAGCRLDERQAWRAAFVQTEAAWEAAYLREGRQLAAFGAIAAVLAA